MKYKFWWIIGIFVLATFVRGYALGSVPVSLYWDEMAMLVDAKSVAQTGQDMHSLSWLQAIFPSYGDYKLPVYIWLAGMSVKLLGVSQLAVRLPSAVAGVISVGVAGLLAQALMETRGERVKTSEKRVNNWWQLLSMLAIATAPWAIVFSRTGFEGNVGQLLVGVSVWLLLLSKNKLVWAYFSTFIGALAVYTYFSIRFVWPVVFTIISLLLILPHLTTKQLSLRFIALETVKRVVLPLLLFLALLAPMSRSPWYQASNAFRYSTDSVLTSFEYPVLANIYRERAGNASVDRVIFHRQVLLAKELASNYADHLSLSFLFVSGDTNLRHGTGHHGLFSLVWLPALVVGIFSLSRKKPRVFIVLVVWWLAALLPASVPENTPHALRSLNALLPLSLLLGWGATHSILWLQQQPKWGKAALIGLALALAFSLFSFVRYYFIHYPVISAPEWQDGYTEIAQKLLQYRQTTSKIYSTNIDERFYLWIMAYGPYTGSDFHQWESQNFMFAEFDGFTFGKPVPHLATGQTVIVAHRENTLADLVARTDLTVEVLDRILDKNNSQAFIISKVTGKEIAKP